jgi:MFS family permease
LPVGSPSIAVASPSSSDVDRGVTYPGVGPLARGGRDCRIDLVPASTRPGARRVLAARALRGFADGLVSVLLARYLVLLGFSPVMVGAIVTGTLLGSAALTVALGLTARRYAVRALLVAACGLMFATGVGFSVLDTFWPLLALAVVGTLNPSAGDVSVFLPTEQAYIAGRVDAADRPRLYALYNLAGALAGALGALVSSGPEWVARHLDWRLITVLRGAFVVYAVTAVVVLLLYRGIQEDRATTYGDGEDRGASPDRHTGRGVTTTLTSRRTVLELAALFSLDSAGSGFVVTSLLVLWLDLRFGLSTATTGTLFFGAGLLGGLSQLLAPVLGRRFGLVRTMAFTHLPANVLLAACAFAPSGGVAIAVLLVRALFAQMDVPARQSFVMAVVPADERAAASSLTNVPRSLASAATPLLAGVLLAHSHFGWPLLIAGGTKVVYDVLLLVLYRNVPEEVGARRSPVS